MASTAQPDELPYWLRVPQFQRQSQLSRNKIFEMLAAGKIRSIKVGRARLIPASEVARLAELDEQ